MRKLLLKTLLAHTPRDEIMQLAWTRLDETERKAWIEAALVHRAKRRAALGAFSLAFEDAMVDVQIDMIHDLNTPSY